MLRKQECISLLKSELEDSISWGWDYDTFTFYCILILQEFAKEKWVRLSLDFNNLSIDDEKWVPLISTCEEIWRTTKNDVIEIHERMIELITFWNIETDDAEFRNLAPKLDATLDAACQQIIESIKEYVSSSLN